MTPLSEENIRSQIKLILEGDNTAYALIVRNFQDQIYAIILSQLGDKTVAGEIAQETFVRAYQYIKSFKGESSFKTWLTRIAINRVKTYFSSKAYQQNLKTESFTAQKHEKLINKQEEDQDNYSEEILEKMREEISNLKEKYKEIIVLKVFEGLSYQEISKTLNIPIGTVSSRMNTALLSLRSRLKEVY
jgi:RNA polymerase sigma-70 factor (ECF subfamily)